LRHGVEFSEKQSFIACIADAKCYGESTNMLSVKEMKQQIIKAINIDEYLTYQNGNNVESFAVESFELMNKLDIKKYENSKLYKKIYKNGSNEKVDSSQDKYFRKVVLSFENFTAYLSDEKSIIDYTYLWDMICKPNALLFPKGINLIVMEIANDDITNNIELICPTNHYSNEFYNPSKQTLFVVKEDGLFEPIYAYENKDKSVKVTKFFSEASQNLSSNMKSIFKNIIKPLLKDTCSPTPSMPTVYKFKMPILLSDLITLLKSNEYEIEKQILNYQSKVVGVFARKNNLSGYIPCYPSAIEPNYSDFTFMNDEKLYKNYEKTIKFLSNIHKETKGKVPTKPEFKIIEDEHVVGILTETNQFIQLSEPIAISSVKDSIPNINDNNYILTKSDKLKESVDYYTSSVDGIDSERASYIRKIKLETNFYNVFRNTIRILLNDYENIKMREMIEKKLEEPYVLYSKKLQDVISNLKELTKDIISFSSSYNNNLIDAVSTCITLPKNKCETKRPVCAFTKGNKCQLILPKQNLLNNSDNEIIYFGKMADELIRYSRIKTFIFQPQTYLSFGTLNYNLRENEIIVIQSLLTKDYFDGLIPEEINKYVRHNTYDTTEPKISQVYDNVVEINKLLKELKDGEQTKSTVSESYEIANLCSPVKTAISSKIWKDSLPSGFKEIYYNETNCGFLLISDIVKNFNETILKKNKIKEFLIEEYGKYFEKYGSQILDILILEGKKELGTKVKKNTLSFDNFIHSEDYFITNLDIWMIMNKYKIPSIIISTKPIILTNKEKNYIVLHGNDSDKFFLIYAPALRAENIPKYSIIISVEQRIEHPLNVIQNDSVRREIIDTISSGISLEKTFQRFTKKMLTDKKMPKLTGKIVIEEDSNEEQKEKKKSPETKKLKSKKNTTKKILKIEE
jgi:hypothetical protein